MRGQKNIGRKLVQYGFASIHEMTGAFAGYHGIVVGCELVAMTPEWADAKRRAIQADTDHGKAA